MENKIDDLKYIRSTMERSTKFLSLSGMSGIMAGTVALLGSFVAYLLIYRGYTVSGNLLIDMTVLAGIVMALAACFGFYFSWQKAKKNGIKFFMPATVEMIKEAGVPFVTGGLFCLMLIYHHCSYLVAAAMLIFYGIAVINAGARTYRDIKILGACEIILGLMAAFLAQYGLLFWAIGFGVMHIVYGIVMYIKYDADTNKRN